MLKTLLMALVVGLFCALVAGPARAQEAEEPQEAQEDDKVLAQERYKTGLNAYNVGNFDLAITEWKVAYQLLAVPDFLFNIAQAYRQKRDYANAVFFYNSYLRGKPDAANVAEVTALRDEMASLWEAEKSTETLPPTDVVEPGKEPPVPSEVSIGTTGTTGESTETTSTTQGGGELGMEADTSNTGDGRKLRLAGMISGGTGVAFLATGIIFALSASSTESDLEAAAANMEVWTDKYKDMESSAERSSTIGTVLMVGGVAAMVAGGVVYYLGHKKGQEARGLAGAKVVPMLAVDDEGANAGLAMGWNF